MGALLGPETGVRATINNTATAVGSDSAGSVHSSPVTATVPVAPSTPGIALVVTSSGITDTNNDGSTDAGDKISYAYKITNTGNVTLTNVTLTDTGVTITGGPIASLAPGQSDLITFTGQHTIGLLDVLAGSYTDSAKTIGTPTTTGAANVSATGNVSTSLAYSAGLNLAITSQPLGSVPHAGDPVQYTYKVSNIGLSLLSNVTLGDPLFAFNDTAKSDRMIALLEGARNPQAAGFATASLNAGPHHAGIVSAANRKARQKRAPYGAAGAELAASRMLVRMSGKTGPLQVGEKIGFLFTLSNTGDVPLTDLRIDQPDAQAYGAEISLLNPSETDAATIIYTRNITADEVARGQVRSNSYLTWAQRGHEELRVLNEGLAISGIHAYDDFNTASIFPISIGILSIGQSQTYQATHPLTQSEINNGTTSTQATATALDIAGITLAKNGSMQMALVQSPSIGVVKTGSVVAADPAHPQAGDKIHYQFTISNPGNVTLTNVTVTDGGSTVTGTPIASLDPGVTDSSSYSADYILTQADIDHGSYQNQATASGHAPDSSTVSALSDNADPAQHRPTIVSITQAPAIGLLKTVSQVVDSNHNGITDAGDVIQYQFKAMNLGNVTLTNVGVTDTPGGGAAVTVTGGPIASLAPNASSTQISGSYTITQADVDAGHVNNTATITGTAPDGSHVAHDSDPAVPTQTSPTVTTFSQNASVALYKKLASSDDSNSDGILDPGDVLHYSFIVQNTGNVSLANIRLTDLLSGVTVAGNSNTITLAPGATDSTTFTATYMVTSADAQAGVVHNQARIDVVQSGTSTAVSAVSKSGDLSASTAGTTDTVVQPTPTIGLELQPPSYADTNNNGVTDAGDTLTYQMVVKNTGAVPLSGVNIVATTANLTISGTYNGTLLAGAMDGTTFTATHVLTAGDIAAGHYDAQAKAQASTASGPANQITSLSDWQDFAQHRATTYAVAANPQLTLYKKLLSSTDVNGDGIVDAGDVLHYAFIVQNSGNVAVTSLQLTELLSGATVAGNGNSVTLQPGQSDSSTFTATYTVTATDGQNGVVHNQARIDAVQSGTSTAVTATSRSGDLTSSTVGTTDTAIAPMPTIGLMLLQPSYADTNNDGVADAGDTLTYALQVKNSSTIPLNAVSVTDNNTGLSIAGTLVGSLNPGATDASTFTATHVLTAADLAAGHYNAQSKVTASTPGATNGFSVNSLSDPSDFSQHRVTSYAIVANPKLAALEIFDHFENAGGTVVSQGLNGGTAVYKVTLKNTGNVALDAVTVAPNGGYTGTVIGSQNLTLAPGATDTTHYILRHLITNNEMLAGEVDSQILATGNDTALGVSATDLSDPSDFTAGHVTVVPLTATPSMALVMTSTVQHLGSSAIVSGTAAVGDVIHYAFQVVNTGNVDLTSIAISNPTATLPSPAPILAVLHVGATDTTTFTATHTVTAADAAAGSYVSQATATGVSTPTQPVVVAQSDNSSISAPTPHATVTPLAGSGAVFTNTAARSQVKRGDAVAYTINATNLSGASYQIADVMPPGFGYLGGSAKINGVAFTPVLKGQVLTFNSLAPAAGKLTLTVTLTASASISGGKFIDTANLVDQSSNVLLASAQAIVEVMPDATFDCSDVIGRVFDDLNGDGYQQDGEPGLPAVRVATVNGLLVTTDSEGRFHVPCAAIPDAAIGSTFLMKLDPHSLPEGYHLTTENPRDVRLTRGKTTEINFGVGRLHQVKVDFNAEAFAANSMQLTPQWSGGIARLIQVLKTKRSDLLLVYHQSNEPGAVAQARANAVAALVNQAWKQSGTPYALAIKVNLEGQP